MSNNDQCTVIVRVPLRCDYDNTPEEIEQGYHEIVQPVCFVSVYRIERWFGGHEEGGWYYNTERCVCSLPLIKPGDLSEVLELTTILAPRFPDEGDIYSSRGGHFHLIRTEFNPGDHNNTERPAYE